MKPNAYFYALTIGVPIFLLFLVAPAATAVGLVIAAAIVVWCFVLYAVYCCFGFVGVLLLDLWVSSL